MTNKYSDLSLELTKSLSKDIKKNNGIFFTPPSTVNNILNILDKYIKCPANILEPSCGSCEFILSLKSKYKKSKITGIECHKVIYDAINNLNSDNITILNEDFIKYSPPNNIKYDLIIGNPPYIVIKKKDIPKKFNEYFEGRPNIFILFIIYSFDLLNENGILSFILPKNFLNCLYYDKTRKYIYKNYTILDIIECNDKYIETQQDTIILIVQNTRPPTELKSEYVIKKREYTIFGTKDNINKLNELYKNSVSLHYLDFKVSVGNIVWNEHKENLTDDSTKTRLIYSSDIKNNELIITKYNNKAKKNYITKKGQTNPLLVINRGYGNGEYKFEYCLIDIDYEYLIENHLICINYIKTETREKIIELYKNIIKSLQDPRTHEFISLYFGNNAINTTELNYILPIYIL